MLLGLEDFCGSRIACRCDRICGEYALALHNAKLTSTRLFQPRNDPDQAQLLGRGTTLLVTGLLLGTLKMQSADMLSLVITLLIIALISGILGFGGIAGAAVGIAKIVFVIALVLFVISLLTHGLRGGFGRGL